METSIKITEDLVYNQMMARGRLMKKLTGASNDDIAQDLVTELELKTDWEPDDVVQLVMRRAFRYNMDNPMYDRLLQHKNEMMAYQKIMSQVYSEYRIRSIEIKRGVIPGGMIEFEDLADQVTWMCLNEAKESGAFDSLTEEEKKMMVRAAVGDFMDNWQKLYNNDPPIIGFALDDKLKEIMFEGKTMKTNKSVQLSLDQIKKICPSCAAKMQKLGWKSVNLTWDQLCKIDLGWLARDQQFNKAEKRLWEYVDQGQTNIVSAKSAAFDMQIQGFVDATEVKTLKDKLLLLTEAKAGNIQAWARHIGNKYGNEADFFGVCTQDAEVSGYAKGDSNIVAAICAKMHFVLFGDWPSQATAQQRYDAFDIDRTLETETLGAMRSVKQLPDEFWDPSMQEGWETYLLTHNDLSLSQAIDWVARQIKYALVESTYDLTDTQIRNEAMEWITENGIAGDLGKWPWNRQEEIQSLRDTGQVRSIKNMLTGAQEAELLQIAEGIRDKYGLRQGEMSSDSGWATLQQAMDQACWKLPYCDIITYQDTDKAISQAMGLPYSSKSVKQSPYNQNMTEWDEVSETEWRNSKHPGWTITYDGEWFHLIDADGVQHFIHTNFAETVQEASLSIAYSKSIKAFQYDVWRSVDGTVEVSYEVNASVPGWYWYVGAEQGGPFDTDQAAKIDAESKHPGVIGWEPVKSAKPIKGSMSDLSIVIDEVKADLGESASVEDIAKEVAKRMNDPMMEQFVIDELNKITGG